MCSPPRAPRAQRRTGRARCGKRAETFYQQLSYAHQREYVRWIEEAKREQTRRERIARAVEMLGQGKRAR